MSILLNYRRIFALILAAILIGNGLFIFYPGVAAAWEANSSTNQDPEQDESGSTIPTRPPSGIEGLPIHRERCSNCHGELGLGDGELAEGLPNPPAAHASVSYLREAVPADMFATITGGRVERGMPPFGPNSSNPLSDEERWNVIAAIYSLGTPVESIEDGQAYYSEACAECHGDEGKGDGPNSAEIDQDPGDLSSLTYWVNNSNKKIFDAIQTSDDFHATGSDEGDLWSVIDYMRTFSYEYADALAPLRPIEVGTVGGQITNGTTGEPVASEAIATLRGFTQDLNITVTLTDTVDSGGRYNFDLTDISQDWFLFMKRLPIRIW